MTYILSLIAYLIASSILGWLANRPKERWTKIGSCYNTSSGDFDDSYYTVLLSDKGSKKMIPAGVQCGKSAQQAEFLERHLGKPFKSKEEK